MNVFYTRELDTNGSSVVKRVLYDADSQNLYLVFNNDTVVVRDFHAFGEEGLNNYIESFSGSWGRAWNSNLKYLSGDNLSYDVTFTKRLDTSLPEEESKDGDLYMVSLSVQLPRDEALKVLNALIPVEKALHDNYGDFYSNLSISTTPEETE